MPRLLARVQAHAGLLFGEREVAAAPPAPLTAPAGAGRVPGASAVVSNLLLVALARRDALRRESRADRHAVRGASAAYAAASCGSSRTYVLPL
jgi:hypothetical protein